MNFGHDTVSNQGRDVYPDSNQNMGSYGHIDNKPVSSEQIPANIDSIRSSPNLSFYLDKAKQGDSAALCYIGYCYAVGQGVEKNIDQSVACYLQAALLGNGEAQRRLNLGRASQTSQDQLKTSTQVSEAIEPQVSEQDTTVDNKFKEIKGSIDNLKRTQRLTTILFSAILVILVGLFGLVIYTREPMPSPNEPMPSPNEPMPSTKTEPATTQKKLDKAQEQEGVKDKEQVKNVSSQSSTEPSSGAADSSTKASQIVFLVGENLDTHITVVKNTEWSISSEVNVGEEIKKIVKKVANGVEKCLLEPTPFEVNNEANNGANKETGFQEYCQLDLKGLITPDSPLLGYKDFRLGLLDKTVVLSCLDKEGKPQFFCLDGLEEVHLRQSIEALKKMPMKGNAKSSSPVPNK